MRVILSGLLWLVLSSAALSQEQHSVDQQALIEKEPQEQLHEALLEEQVDAAQRQQQELESRAAALSEQTKTTQELLQRQQQYIEQLEAQIRALQNTSDSDD